MDFHKCNCGNVLYLQKYRNTAEEIAYADGDDYTLEVEVECAICGAKYEIEVEATISVQSDILSIECTYEPSPELNGIDISSLTIGDSVDATDGMYQVGAKQYCIENGILTAIFNGLVDENQLQLEF